LDPPNTRSTRLLFFLTVSKALPDIASSCSPPKVPMSL
jgi:hypothetical protein